MDGDAEMTFCEIVARRCRHMMTCFYEGRAHAVSACFEGDCPDYERIPAELEQTNNLKIRGDDEYTRP